MCQNPRKLTHTGCHLGTKNCNHQMERYVHTRRQDGIYVINLEKTWEKLQMAARIIVAIENPQDVVVLSARPYGQRAVRGSSLQKACGLAGGFWLAAARRKRWGVVWGVGRPAPAGSKHCASSSCKVRVSVQRQQLEAAGRKRVGPASCGCNKVANGASQHGGGSRMLEFWPAPSNSTSKHLQALTAAVAAAACLPSGRSRSRWEHMLL
jgi:hypothetical protein